MISPKFIILLLTIFSTNLCQDFTSNSYLKLSANEKMQRLWTEISKDQTGLDFYSDFELAKIFLSDMWITFRQKGDVLPEGRKKLIHTTGNVAKATFEAERNSPYTGIFKGSNNMLIRFSIAKKVTTWFHTSASGALGNFVPGISLKFLRDGIDSGNLLAMFSTGGQESWNPFANDFTNVFELGNPGIQEKSLAVKFSSVTNYVSSVGVYDLASYGENGVLVGLPRYPFKLIFRPTAKVRYLFPDIYEEYFTEQLKKIPSGTPIYDVYAIDEPGCNESKIGTIKINTQFITSKFGDENLFFRHGMIDEDDVGKNWAQYRDYFSVMSGGITPAKEAPKKTGCPFSKLF